MTCSSYMLLDMRHNTKKFPSVVTEMVVLIFLTKHAKS